MKQIQTFHHGGAASFEKQMYHHHHPITLIQIKSVQTFQFKPSISARRPVLKKQILYQM